MVAVNLSKQQALDPDRKAIQQINFIESLDKKIIRDSISFLKKQKKLSLNFHNEL